MSKLKLGINKNIENSQYHGDREYVSSSGLKLMLNDPERFYKQYVTGEIESKSSTAFDFGSYIHTLVLEPHLEEDEYAFYQGATRRGREYDKFVAEHPDKIVILEQQRPGAKQLQDAVFNHPQAGPLFTDGVPEQTLCVKLEGVPVKVRCDYMKGNKIVDLKTTGYGVSYTELVNTCVKYDYDLSAALYVDSWSQFTGEHHDFYFVFVSKKSTEVSVVKASRQFIENGRRKYQAALKRLIKARETGVYFDPAEVKKIYVPDGAIYREEK